MKKRPEHSFSAEMKSKEYIKQISFPANGGKPVLIEGFLGKLEKVSMIEGLMLEIKGVNGILRIDIEKSELEQRINMKNKSNYPSKTNHKSQKQHLQLEESL